MSSTICALATPPGAGGIAVVRVSGPEAYIGYSVNVGAVQVVNTVHEENRPFFGSEQWYAEGFANVKLTEAVILCHAGVNTLRFYAVSPAIILEKIVLWPDGTTLPESYLGPRESYRC